MNAAELKVEFDMDGETKNFYTFTKPKNRNPEMFPAKIYLDKELFVNKPTSIIISFEVK